jgi:8-oxo-dGTP diphosphatase
MKIKNTQIKIVRKNIKVELGFKDDQSLRKFVEIKLEQADKLKQKKLYLASSQLEKAKLPIQGIAKIMAQAILKYLRTHESAIKEISICVPDSVYKTFKENVYDYLDYMLYKMQHAPYVTVDMIIERPDGIIMIERSNPPYGWALPGGFVDYGETLENAAIRETKEETDLKLLNPKQLGAYSNPKRDPRFHTIAVAFVAKGVGQPKSGDDAKDLKIVPYKNLLKVKYCFDHRQIVLDYLKTRNKILTK